MSSSYLFENGTIVDGTGAVAQLGAVLVENEKIAAIGDDATRRATVDATRIDARGMTVMPGLIDAHVHLSFDDAQSNAEIFFHRRNALSALVAAYNARKVLRAGVTSILDPDSVAARSRCETPPTPASISSITPPAWTTRRWKPSSTGAYRSHRR